MPSVTYYAVGDIQVYHVTDSCVFLRGSVEVRRITAREVRSGLLERCRNCEFIPVKTCARCKLLLPVTEFSPWCKCLDGLRGHCRVCDKMEKRAYWKRIPDERKRAYSAKSRNSEDKRERNRVRARTRHMIRQGLLARPSRCSQCQDKVFVEAHHKDYSKPLDVVWLCKKCHSNVGVSPVGELKPLIKWVSTKAPVTRIPVIREDMKITGVEAAAKCTQIIRDLIDREGWSFNRVCRESGIGYPAVRLYYRGETKRSRKRAVDALERLWESSRNS